MAQFRMSKTRRLKKSFAEDVRKKIGAEYVIILASYGGEGEFVWSGHNEKACQNAQAVGEMIQTIGGEG